MPTHMNPVHILALFRGETPWLRQLLLAHTRDLREIHVGSVVDKVVLGWVSLHVLCFLITIIPPMIHTHLSPIYKDLPPCPNLSQARFSKTRFSRINHNTVHQNPHSTNNMKNK
jgi:hypothetical protein